MSTATATSPTPISPATSLLAPNSFKGFTLDQIFKALEADPVTPAQIASIEWNAALWSGMQQGNSSAADPVKKLFILLGSRVAYLDPSFFWQIRLSWVMPLAQYLTSAQIAQFKFDQLWQTHEIFGGWDAIDTFLGNLGSKAQFLSRDLVHNLECKEVQIIAQYLTASQGSTLLADRFGAIVSGLRPEQLTQASAAQIATLSVDQIKNLTPAQLAAFPVAVFATLSIGTLQQLSPEQIKALSPKQVAAFTPAQFVALTPAQAAVLTAAQLELATQNSAIADAIIYAGQEVGAINRRNLTPVALVIPATVWAVFAVLNLGTALLQKISRASLLALDPTQLGTLSAEQVAAIAIGPQNAGILNVGSAEAFSAAQFAALPDLSGLDRDHLRELSTATLLRFTVLQISTLSLAQLRTLSARADFIALLNHVGEPNGWGVVQVRALSPLFFGQVSSATFALQNNLLSTVFNQLARAFWAALAPAQLANISAELFHELLHNPSTASLVSDPSDPHNWSARQIQALLPSTIARIAPEDIALLTPTFFSTLTELQFSRLTAEQSHAMNSAQIEAVLGRPDFSRVGGTTMVRQFNAQQLSAAQLLRNTLVDSSALPQPLIRSLSDEQIAQISAQTLNTQPFVVTRPGEVPPPTPLLLMTPHQIGALTATQVQGLEAANLARLLAAQNAGWITDQLDVMTVAQVRSLNISAMSPMQLGSINHSTSTPLPIVQMLSPTQLQIVPQILKANGFDANSLQFISKERIAKITPELMRVICTDSPAMKFILAGGWDIGQLNSLDPAAFGAIPSRDLAITILADNLLNLSPGVIAGITGAQLHDLVQRPQSAWIIQHAGEPGAWTIKQLQQLIAAALADGHLTPDDLAGFADLGVFSAQQVAQGLLMNSDLAECIWTEGAMTWTPERRAAYLQIPGMNQFVEANGLNGGVGVSPFSPPQGHIDLSAIDLDKLNFLLLDRSLSNFTSRSIGTINPTALSQLNEIAIQNVFTVLVDRAALNVFNLAQIAALAAHPNLSLEKLQLNRLTIALENEAFMGNLTSRGIRQIAHAINLAPWALYNLNPQSAFNILGNDLLLGSLVLAAIHNLGSSLNNNPSALARLTPKQSAHLLENSDLYNELTRNIQNALQANARPEQLESLNKKEIISTQGSIILEALNPEASITLARKFNHHPTAIKLVIGKKRIAAFLRNNAFVAALNSEAIMKMGDLLRYYLASHMLDLPQTRSFLANDGALARSLRTESSNVRDPFLKSIIMHFRELNAAEIASLQTMQDLGFYFIDQILSYNSAPRDFMKLNSDQLLRVIHLDILDALNEDAIDTLTTRINQNPEILSGLDEASTRDFINNLERIPDLAEAARIALANSITANLKILSALSVAQAITLGSDTTLMRTLPPELQQALRVNANPQHLNNMDSGQIIELINRTNLRLINEPVYAALILRISVTPAILGQLSPAKLELLWSLRRREHPSWEVALSSLRDPLFENAFTDRLSAYFKKQDIPQILQAIHSAFLGAFNPQTITILAKGFNQSPALLRTLNTASTGDLINTLNLVSALSVEAIQAFSASISTHLEVLSALTPAQAVLLERAGSLAKGLPEYLQQVLHANAHPESLRELSVEQILETLANAHLHGLNQDASTALIYCINSHLEAILSFSQRLEVNPEVLGGLSMVAIGGLLRNPGLLEGLSEKSFTIFAQSIMSNPTTLNTLTPEEAAPLAGNVTFLEALPSDLQTALRGNADPSLLGNQTADDTQWTIDHTNLSALNREALHTFIRDINEHPKVLATNDIVILSGILSNLGRMVEYGLTESALTELSKSIQANPEVLRILTSEQSGSVVAIAALVRTFPAQIYGALISNVTPNNWSGLSEQQILERITSIDLSILNTCSAQALAAALQQGPWILSALALKDIRNLLSNSNIWRLFTSEMWGRISSPAVLQLIRELPPSAHALLFSSSAFLQGLPWPCLVEALGKYDVLSILIVEHLDQDFVSNLSFNGDLRYIDPRLFSVRPLRLEADNFLLYQFFAGVSPHLRPEIIHSTPVILDLLGTLDSATLVGLLDGWRKAADLDILKLFFAALTSTQAQDLLMRLISIGNLSIGVGDFVLDQKSPVYDTLLYSPPMQSAIRQLDARMLFLLLKSDFSDAVKHYVCGQLTAVQVSAILTGDVFFGLNYVLQADIARTPAASPEIMAQIFQELSNMQINELFAVFENRPSAKEIWGCWIPLLAPTQAAYLWLRSDVRWSPTLQTQLFSIEGVILAVLQQSRSITELFSSLQKLYDQPSETLLAALCIPEEGKQRYLINTILTSKTELAVDVIEKALGILLEYQPSLLNEITEIQYLDFSLLQASDAGMRTLQGLASARSAVFIGFSLMQDQFDRLLALPNGEGWILLDVFSRLAMLDPQSRQDRFPPNVTPPDILRTSSNLRFAQAQINAIGIDVEAIFCIPTLNFIAGAHAEMFSNVVLSTPLLEEMVVHARIANLGVIGNLLQIIPNALINLLLAQGVEDILSQINANQLTQWFRNPSAAFIFSEVGQAGHIPLENFQALNVDALAEALEAAPAMRLLFVDQQDLLTPTQRTALENAGVDGFTSSPPPVGMISLVSNFSPQSDPLAGPATINGFVNELAASPPTTTPSTIVVAPPLVVTPPLMAA